MNESSNTLSTQDVLQETDDLLADNGMLEQDTGLPAVQGLNGTDILSGSSIQSSSTCSIRSPLDRSTSQQLAPRPQAPQRISTSQPQRPPRRNSSKIRSFNSIEIDSDEETYERNNKRMKLQYHLRTLNQNRNSQSTQPQHVNQSPEHNRPIPPQDPPKPPAPNRGHTIDLTQT